MRTDITALAKAASDPATATAKPVGGAIPRESTPTKQLTTAARQLLGDRQIDTLCHQLDSSLCCMEKAYPEQYVDSPSGATLAKTVRSYLSDPANIAEILNDAAKAVDKEGCVTVFSNIEDRIRTFCAEDRCLSRDTMFTRWRKKAVAIFVTYTSFWGDQNWDVAKFQALCLATEPKIINIFKHFITLEINARSKDVSKLVDKNCTVSKSYLQNDKAGPLPVPKDFAQRLIDAFDNPSSQSVDFDMDFDDVLHASRESKSLSIDELMKNAKSDWNMQKRFTSSPAAYVATLGNVVVKLRSALDVSVKRGHPTVTEVLFKSLKLAEVSDCLLF